MDDEALEEEIRQQYELERSFPPGESLGSGPVLPARDATPKSASRAATPDDSRVAEATTPAPKATQGRGAGSSMEGSTPTPQARKRLKRPPGSPVVAMPVPKRRLVALEGGLSWRRLRDDVFERSSGKEDQQGEAEVGVGDRLDRASLDFTAFSELSRDDKRNKYAALWMASRKEGFFETSSLVERRKQGYAQFAGRKEFDIELDIRRWQEKGFTLRCGRPHKGPQAHQPELPRKRGRKAAIRTYILRVERQPVFSELVRRLKALDPEEQEDEYHELMKAIRQLPVVQVLFRRFSQFNEGVVCEIQATEWTVTFEVCMGSGPSELHAHAVDSILKRSLEAPEADRDFELLTYGDDHKWMAFGGQQPHIRFEALQSRRHWADSVHCVHYYGQLPKVGHVCFNTNIRARFDFAPKNKWVMQRLQKRAILLEDARGEVEENRDNTVGYLRQVDCLIGLRDQRRSRQRKQHLRAMLAKTRKPWKALDPVTQKWMKKYTARHRSEKSRWKFLVWKGGSLCGKTCRAATLFGEEETLVVECQKSTEPNLDEFENQKCIVLDEATAEMCASNKVLMTASSAGVTLRQSPTQQSARNVVLHGVAIIVCCNKWLDDDDDSEDAKWLRKNSEFVEIQGQLFEGGEDEEKEESSEEEETEQ